MIIIIIIKTLLGTIMSIVIQMKTLIYGTKMNRDRTLSENLVTKLQSTPEKRQQLRRTTMSNYILPMCTAILSTALSGTRTRAHHPSRLQ